MKVGILIITHCHIGSSILQVTKDTLGELPLKMHYLDVDQNEDPDYFIAKGVSLANQLDSGEGVLVLTDMYGSTPSNVAHKLQHFGLATRVVSGLNLPMVLKILNYPDLKLNELTEKAVNGGKEGIIEPLSENKLKTENSLPSKPIRY